MGSAIPASAWWLVLRPYSGYPEMRVRTQDTSVLMATPPRKGVTSAGATLRSLSAHSECTSNYEKALDMALHIHRLCC